MAGEGLDDLRADHLGEEVRREAGWRRTIARLEGENAELAAALRAIQRRSEINATTWTDGFPRKLANDVLGIINRDARAALSGEGKVWEQVVEVIEVLFSLADRIPADVRQRVEAVLAAMKGE